ncbi:hypothetical protein DVH24_039780 [Malus domestica]|uniref:Trichome birefringence-like N-terminal domain-containing protein n=1 Tax=Malus domestica TaxID=3750 RepID=A0A498I4I8_MALDO|nr:hypothetical protein DVH24_039780 [Malus domestica]
MKVQIIHRVRLVRGTGRNGTGRGVPFHVWYAKNWWNALFHGTEIWCFCVPPSPVERVVPRMWNTKIPLSTLSVSPVASLPSLSPVASSSSSSSTSNPAASSSTSTLPPPQTHVLGSSRRFIFIFVPSFFFATAFSRSLPLILSRSSCISICISSFDLDLLQESLHLPVCNYAKGKWVVDHKKLLYSGHGCKQCLSSMWSCRMTKRTDFSYEKVSWQPKDCQMEEFEGYKFLKRLYESTDHNTMAPLENRSPCMLLQHISSVGIVGIS